MEELEAVGLDLEEIFVAREFFHGRGVGRERQARFGGSFDFVQEILHGRT